MVLIRGIRKGLELKRIWLQKDNMTNPSNKGNALYLDCINADVLVVIIVYKFLPLRESCKGHLGFLYYFIQVHVNL